jgi:hypothetical protein
MKIYIQKFSLSPDQRLHDPRIRRVKEKQTIDEIKHNYAKLIKMAFFVRELEKEAKTIFFCFLSLKVIFLNTRIPYLVS